MATKHAACGRSAAQTALIGMLGMMLTACGTTSSLKVPPEHDGAAMIDLTPYTRLLIEDFIDQATAKAKPEVQPVLKPKMDHAMKSFPDQIAAVTREGGGFNEVVRSGTPDDSTLILRGAITQLDDGKPMLRLMVGFGAGTANFDARLELIDGGTSKVLGTWIVDKNSWALGGGIAAAQRPEDFIQEAARKIGTELSTKRKQGAVQAPAR